MKLTSFSLFTVAVGLALLPHGGHAQQALRTDQSGNPLTTFNLGGSNISGILPVDRLPARIGEPTVQTITQTQGEATLLPGVGIAVLSAPLTGLLTLKLPSPGTYSVGRRLSVVDPAGYSASGKAVAVAPPSGCLLNGNAAAATVLQGSGSVDVLPDVDGTKWSVGMGYLRAPTKNGLVLAGPAIQDTETLLSLRNGAGAEVFGVRGEGSLVVQNFTANGVFSSDNGNVSTDGNGNLSATSLTATGDVSAVYVKLYNPEDLSVEPVLEGHAWLFYGVDGRMHVRTPDGADHVLAWDAP